MISSNFLMQVENESLSNTLTKFLNGELSVEDSRAIISTSGLSEEAKMNYNLLLDVALSKKCDKKMEEI